MLNLNNNTPNTLPAISPVQNMFFKKELNTKSRRKGGQHSSDTHKNDSNPDFGDFDSYLVSLLGDLETLKKQHKKKQYQ